MVARIGKKAYTSGHFLIELKELTVLFNTEILLLTMGTNQFSGVRSVSSEDPGFEIGNEFRLAVGAQVHGVLVVGIGDFAGNDQ